MTGTPGTGGMGRAAGPYNPTTNQFWGGPGDACDAVPPVSDWLASGALEDGDW